MISGSEMNWFDLCRLEQQKTTALYEQIDRLYAENTEKSKTITEQEREIASLKECLIRQRKEFERAKRQKSFTQPLAVGRRESSRRLKSVSIALVRQIAIKAASPLYQINVDDEEMQEITKVLEETAKRSHPVYCVDADLVTEGSTVMEPIKKRSKSNDSKDSHAKRVRSQERSAEKSTLIHWTSVLKRNYNRYEQMQSHSKELFETELMNYIVDHFGTSNVKDYFTADPKTGKFGIAIPSKMESEFYLKWYNGLGVATI